MKITGKDLEKLHCKLLDLLVFFKCFCEKNDLHFYLGFGSCLGAVRDKGFIPWDDDVDLLMPPEDYIKLKKIWPSGKTIEHFTLCDATEKYCDGHLELTVRDNNTTYITPGDLDLDTHHGIMIEISPLSYSSSSRLRCLRQSINACLYAVFRVQRVSNTGSGLQKRIINGLLKLVHSRETRYKIWKHSEKYIINPYEKDKKYVRVFGQFHTLKRYYPAEIFEDIVWVPFENTTMPVPKGYKRYLTMLYGDFMTPPRIDDRIPEHNVEFIDCDTPYLKYRGSRYLLGEGSDGAYNKVDSNLRSVQMACLSILKKLKEVCEENNIRYYLAYGTLLGAIRHGGYIPWDDDIDVWMPRPDMERFIRIAQTQMRPFVINYYSIHNDASFKYRSQPCVEDQRFRVGFDLGGKVKNGCIWIDIMPLDGMPNSLLAQRIQCKRFSFMYMLIGFARSARIGAFNKGEKHGLKKVGIILNEKFKIGNLLNVENELYRFDKIRKKYSFKDSDYVVGTTTTYTEKAVFLKKWFQGDRTVLFEGEEFSIPNNAEMILHSLYGDYMKLPPVEKRVRSHFAVLYKNGNECEK